MYDKKYDEELTASDEKECEEMRAKNTVKVKIKEPMWKDKTIGIHPRYVGHDLEIEITYKDVNGLRLWPNVFFIPSGGLEKYPLESFKRDLKLYRVPINSLEVL